MWTERVERLKHLRRNLPDDPHQWVQASELVEGDRFLFAGDWFRVLDLQPVEPHVQTSAIRGRTRTVVDYLAFEMVKVALPRPGTGAV